MEKRVVFRHKVLPYLLVAPQIAVTLVFFIWPASQALLQSFLQEDAFGTSSRSSGLKTSSTSSRAPSTSRPSA